METLRYTAFSADARGGNSAGVALDARGASDEEMLAVAAELGFSETAFLAARNGEQFDVRYFSPLAEVPFCGHATIAAAVAYAERHGAGALTFITRAGSSGHNDEWITWRTASNPDQRGTAHAKHHRQRPGRAA